ncbi:MAG: PilZ domain-containing protein [Gammaproteobacteria bacterium]|jgi:Tfp pilus assembly protein PilZ|nr:PilZ domain-containing protein [Gammaproteobacteria bacterium]
MGKNKRKHTRLNVDIPVSIEVEAPDISSGRGGKVLPCRVMDVSYGGFSVCVNHELIVGSVLSVMIELPAVAEPFRLVGEVMWCRHVGEPSPAWNAGFQLFFSRDSDIDAWRDIMRQI